MKKLISLILALLMAASLVACTGETEDETLDETAGDTGNVTVDQETAENEEETDLNEILEGVHEGRFAKAMTAKTLYVYPDVSANGVPAYYELSEADCLLLGTLQGLTAKYSEEQIYIGKDDRVRSITERDWNVTWCDTVGGQPITVDSLVAYYADKNVYKGYILCTETNKESVYVAVSIAGLLDGVVVTEETKHKLDDLGFECLLDVSDKNDMWLRQSEYWDKLDKDIAIERYYVVKNPLHPELIESSHRGVPGLIDLAVLNGAYYTIYEGNSEEEHSAHFEYLNDGGHVLGWYIPLGEAGVVRSLGKINASIIPSDNNTNMSVLSGFPLQSITQERLADDPVDAENVHTVTFVYTDGDNIWWYIDGHYTTNLYFFYNPDREFSLGWGLPPTSLDLMGPIATYLYENKHEQDEFIMSLTATGYTYASRWDVEARRAMTEELAQYMDRMDLRYMVMLDDAAFNEELLADYTEHEAIEGIFYVGFDVQAGRVLWTNGKPTVGCRKDLWNGYTGQYNEILTWLSRDTLSVNPSKTRSYSMYYVCAWNCTPDVVETLIGELPEHVDVVTPSEFMDRMVANCKPDDQ